MKVSKPYLEHCFTPWGVKNLDCGYFALQFMLIITQIIRSCAITNYITSSILFISFCFATSYFRTGVQLIHRHWLPWLLLPIVTCYSDLYSGKSVKIHFPANLIHPPINILGFCINSDICHIICENR